MNQIGKDIHRLSSQISPSGFETNVVNMWMSLIKPYVNAVDVSSLGDGIAIMNGEDDQSLMIVAHADEIGFIITMIDSDKQIAFFDEIGGIDTRLFLGRHVKIVSSTGDIIDGIIGCQPIHCQPRFSNSENGRVEPKDLFIDFGNNISKVSLGDYGVIDQTCIESGDNISGRAMDDRSGLAVMIKVAQMFHGQTPKHTIYFVASSMEEIGARGIRTVVNRYSPSKLIAVDVAIATDTLLHSQNNRSSIELGKGAVIAIGPNIDHEISNQLQRMAKQEGIPYQLEVCARPTGTDANPAQIKLNGIPCGLIGIPCRYMHSPVETINIKDVESASRLIYNYTINL